ncbi:MAG TPA: hypothetical protein VHE35_13975 [Kofleriaceae bacterium]|nr:hypothetical protein [Kofleriaceae bacterium]
MSRASPPRSSRPFHRTAAYAGVVAGVALLAAACGSRSDGDPTEDASVAGGDDASVADAPAVDASVDTPVDAPVDAGPPPVDAFPAVLDVRLDCRNDCVLVASPPSISVVAGTEFEVNWINTGDTECDVAKIDQFNQVPIILGLEPGTSYHDSVRRWCGTFTGTFQFRISICTLPSYIPVDCGAN